MSDCKSEMFVIGAKAAHTVRMHVLICVSYCQWYINIPCRIALGSGGKHVALTTPLTYSFSQRIIRHCRRSKIDALLSQVWVSSQRVFLLPRPAGLHLLAISSEQDEYNGEMFIEWCGIVYCINWLVYWLTPSYDGFAHTAFVDGLVMFCVRGG